MSKDNFWFFALVACFIIGLASNWILPARVLVIGCSVVVLMQVAFRLYQLLKGAKNSHVTK